MEGNEKGLVVGKKLDSQKIQLMMMMEGYTMGSGL